MRAFEHCTQGVGILELGSRLMQGSGVLGPMIIRHGFQGPIGIFVSYCPDLSLQCSDTLKVSKVSSLQVSSEVSKRYISISTFLMLLVNTYCQ